MWQAELAKVVAAICLGVLGGVFATHHGAPEWASFSVGWLTMATVMWGNGGGEK